MCDNYGLQDLLTSIIDDPKAHQGSAPTMLFHGSWQTDPPFSGGVCQPKYSFQHLAKLIRFQRNRRISPLIHTTKAELSVEAWISLQKGAFTFAAISIQCVKKAAKEKRKCWAIRGPIEKSRRRLPSKLLLSLYPGTTMRLLTLMGKGWDAVRSPSCLTVKADLGCRIRSSSWRRARSFRTCIDSCMGNTWIGLLST